MMLMWMFYRVFDDANDENYIRAFQALCLNEFRGLKFEHENTYDLQTGEQVSLTNRLSIVSLDFGLVTVEGI